MTPSLRRLQVVDGVLGAGRDVLCALRELSENLIQAVNIVGSIFYGVALGLVLVAFFFKTVPARPCSGRPHGAVARLRPLLPAEHLLSLVQRHRLRRLRAV